MPDCTQIDPLVTPYVDGELALDAARVVDEHLQHCPTCHQRVAAERVVSALVRERHDALAERAPARLHASCARIAAGATDTADTSRAAPVSRAATVSRAPKPVGSRPPRHWRSRMAPLAMAAALVMFVGGAFVYRATQVSTRVMAAELATDHVKCFMMNAALSTAQSPEVVEAAMASKFGWTADLPDNAHEAGLELVGERTCLYGEGRVAHIMYKHDGHPVSVFMLPDAARAQEMVRVLGHEAAVWSVGTRSFVLVSREPRPVVERMASFVHAGLR
jgi:anti-sigma factor RsiW